MCVGVLLCLASCQRHVASSAADADIDGPLPDACATVPQPAENADACAHLAEVQCSRYMACSIYDFQRAWPDMMTCEAREQLRCTLELGANGTGATATTALACADSVAAMSCDQVLHYGLTTSCGTAGALDNSSGCTFDSQCKSGFCAGTCQDARVAGGPCAKSGPKGGYDCGDTMYCVQSRCELPLAKDAMCMSNGMYIGVCGLGLACIAPGQHFGTCQPTTTTVGTTCIQPGGPVCDFDFSGLDCNYTTGKCVQVQFANVGEPCDLANRVLCRGSVECDGTCWALPREGEACPGLRCEWPAECDTNNGTCTLLGANCQ